MVKDLLYNKWCMGMGIGFFCLIISKVFLVCV